MFYYDITLSNLSNNYSELKKIIPYFKRKYSLILTILFGPCD